MGQLFSIFLNKTCDGSSFKMGIDDEVPELTNEQKVADLFNFHVFYSRHSVYKLHRLVLDASYV